MMDPGHHSRTDDNRDFPRKLRDGRKQQLPGAIPRTAENSVPDYREIFDFAPDAYLITDVYGNIREANIAAGKLLGVEPRLLAGKPLPGFFDEKGRQEYKHQLDRICDLDRLDDWEIALQPRSGEPVAVSVSIARASKGKGSGGYRWMLRDITKRVRAEKELRELNRNLELRVAARTAQLAAANHTKDQLLLSERGAREEAEAANRVRADFLALLSHEFRTPLQAILGYTELLERQIHGPLNEAQLGDLRRIQQSQQHLLGLISTILDLSRLDSGQEIELRLCPIAVHDILREMEGFIGSQLKKRGLSFRYDCSDKELLAVADAGKVQQIVLNLLANALKFTPPGGHLSLSCEREGDMVAIRVADSGVGIPEDRLKSLFEPFAQNSANRSIREGTGLGLRISRRLATAMRGTLTVTSDSGKGSTFILRLPLAQSGP